MDKHSFLPEYQDFAANDFDPTRYANNIVQGHQAADISTAIAKLSYGLEHLDTLLKTKITTSQQDLLHQLTQLVENQQFTMNIQKNLDQLKECVSSRISDPYFKLQSLATQLENIYQVTNVLKQIQRLLQLKKRIQAHLTGESVDLLKAALALSEVEPLLSDTQLKSLKCLNEQFDAISEYRNRVRLEAKTLLERGFKENNQADVYTGISVYKNLNEMEVNAKRTFNDMMSQLDGFLKEELHINEIHKAVKESTANNVANPWAQIMYHRFEKVADAIYAGYSQVYMLQTVLDRSIGEMGSMDALHSLDLKSQFWLVISKALERDLHACARQSQNVAQILHQNYPSYLRIFVNLNERVCGIEKSTKDQERMTKYLRQALSTMELAYLTRASSRFHEMTTISASEKAKGLSSKDEVDKLMRFVTSEIEGSKFDGHFLVSISKMLSRGIDSFVMKLEAKFVTDATAFQFASAPTASTAQLINLDLTNALWYLDQQLWDYSSQISDDAYSYFKNSITLILKTFKQLLESQLVAIARELEMTLLKVHTEEKTRIKQDTSTNKYMLELSSKLRWLQREFFARLNCGEDVKKWAVDLAVRLVHVFARNATMIKLSNEQIKLRLASDSTQLEFALNQLLSAYQIKLDTHAPAAYTLLKNFKPLLFMESNELVGMKQIPKIILLHLLFIRSEGKLTLPHLLENWTETQYGDWVDRNDEQELSILYKRALDHYANQVSAKGETQYCPEYPLLRNVLTE